MKTQIHINMHTIRANKKHGKRDPVITCKTYKSNTYGHEVDISGPSKVVSLQTNLCHVVQESGLKPIHNM